MSRLDWQRSDLNVVIDSDDVGAVVRSIAILAQGFGGASPGGPSLQRLTLDIRKPELHAIPWEQLLRESALPSFRGPIVRISLVVPRVAQASFTVPLRILLVGSASVAQQGILSLFGGHDPDLVAEAVVVASADELEKPPSWPVVDIVHLPSLLSLADEHDLLSPSVKRAGTMGWLARLLDDWQTRLLILDADDRPSALARRVAAALVARGGPAVLVRRSRFVALPLYERIIHDSPLDAIETGDVDSLFGGAGREELVRVSNAGAIVAELGREAPGTRGLETMRGPISAQDMAIRGFSRTFDNFTFNVHEGDGLIPMAAAINTVRAEAEASPEAHAEAISVRPKPRFVNGSLWDGNGTRMSSKRQRFALATDYQLRIQIAGQDRKIPVYGSSTFQEVPKTKPDQRGVWLEVAVNGVGFEIEGDPVQQLWVPFDAISDVVIFTVRPTRSGASVLRYTLYSRQNVLQTFRIAALVAPEAAPGPVTAEEGRALADALDIPNKDAPTTTWIARLEYAAAAITEADQHPERDLSIVANDIAGNRVITVKGEEFFTDTEAGDIAPLVADVREALLRSSLDSSFPDRRDWLYRFGKTAAVNEAAFAEALPVLARAGWLLYDRVLAYSERKRVEQTLQGESRKIAIAHTLLEDVIPWAAVYDRMFKEPDGGSAEICTASLPDSNGVLPATECGTLAGCPLKNGSDPKHVACALRFWGFRHVIEIPPKQVSVAPAATAAPAQPVAAPSGPRLAAVANAALKTTDAHLSHLALLEHDGTAVHWAIEKNPSKVIAALEDETLDVVYLYCHARGGVADPQFKPPCLEFTDGGKTVRISSDELDSAPWTTKPLVLLNGCSSAAYSSEALAPFVRKFTRDRQAGGVLGTEIPVHEALAGDVAEQFLARYLRDEQAGPALLAVRRSLLAQKNPLGLAYTLFAFAELSLREG